MACSKTLAGYTALDCDPSKGGVKNIYIINYDALSAVGISKVSGSTEEEQVTGFTTNTASTAPTDVKWHMYSMRRNTASMTSTLNFDETAGVNYVSTDVLLRFNKLDTPQRLEMTALCLAETRVVVEDANGKWWMVGIDEPVVPSSGNAQTGVQKTDGSYYELTLQGSDDTWPLELSEAAISAIKADLASA
jgi:hypothetical protein